MQRIEHKLDGSPWGDGDPVEQLVADGAQEIPRPDSWVPGLAVIRYLPDYAPGLWWVSAEVFNELAKPTGPASRWFRYPGPALIEEQSPDLFAGEDTPDAPPDDGEGELE